MRSLRARNTERGGPGPARPAGTRLEGLSFAFGRLRAWRKRAGIAATLARLEDFQLEDLGIQRGNIPAFARASSAAPRLLGAMLERLGADAQSGERSELLRNCRICLNLSPCERWLKSGEPSDRYRQFCPNAPRLDALRGQVPTTLPRPAAPPMAAQHPGR